MSKKKYVVESAFENVSVQKIMQLGLDANCRIINWTDSIEDVEELNSDYINGHYGQLQDEAYQKGYKEGRNVGIKDGMCDAWEAAKKIVADTDHGGLNSDALSEIFGSQISYTHIMSENTAQEAIDKIKAYEEKQADRIKVGDEVIWKCDKNIVIVVTSVYTVGRMEWCDGVTKEGKAYSLLTENARKTGKHYDIQSILEEMKKCGTRNA